jgi:hypothetical protein
MKIRTGFISNSSSSSFVVAFPYKPETVEDLQKMMFGKQKFHYISIYGEKGVTDYPTHSIVEQVFRDINKKATNEEVIESIEHGHFDAYIHPEICPGRYDNWDQITKLIYEKDKEEMERLWEEEAAINHARASAIASAFIDHNKNKFIVVLEYGDEGGEFEAILEHTDIFQRIQHIRTSYH